MINHLVDVQRFPCVLVAHRVGEGPRPEDRLTLDNQGSLVFVGVLVVDLLLVRLDRRTEIAGEDTVAPLCGSQCRFGHNVTKPYWSIGGLSSNTRVFVFWSGTGGALMRSSAVS